MRPNSIIGNYLMSLNAFVRIFIIANIVLVTADAFQLMPVQYVAHRYLAQEDETAWPAQILVTDYNRYYFGEMVFNSEADRVTHEYNITGYVLDSHDNLMINQAATPDACYRPSSRAWLACEDFSCFCNCVLGLEIGVCYDLPPNYHYAGYINNPRDNLEMTGFYTGHSCTGQNWHYRFEADNLCCAVNTGTYIRSWMPEA